MYSTSAVLGLLMAGLGYSVIVTGKLVYFWFSFLVFYFFHSIKLTSYTFYAFFYLFIFLFSWTLGIMHHASQASGCISHIGNAFLSFTCLVDSCKFFPFSSSASTPIPSLAFLFPLLPQVLFSTLAQACCCHPSKLGAQTIFVPPVNHFSNWHLIQYTSNLVIYNSVSFCFFVHFLKYFISASLILLSYFVNTVQLYKPKSTVGR